jgi:hypothetical protein
MGLTPETLQLVDKVVNSITGLGMTIMGTLTPAFTGLSSGGVVDAINQGIIFLNENFEILQAAILGVGAIVATGVFAALLAGIVSLLTPMNLIIAAAATLGAAWQGNWFGIRDTTLEVVQLLTDGLNNVMLALDQFGARGAIISTLAQVFGLSSDQIIAGMTAIENAWIMLQATWQTGAAIVQGVISGIVAATGPAFAQLGEELGKLGITFGELGITWESIGGTLLTATQVVFAGVGAAILAVVSILTSFAATVAATISTSIETMQVFFSAVQETWTGIGQIITGFVQLFGGDFAGGLATIGEGIKTTLSGLAEAIVTILTAPFRVVIVQLQTFGSSMYAFWEGLYNTLVGNSIIPDMINAIIEWFAFLPTRVTEIIGGLVDTVTGLFSSMSGNLLGGLFGGGEEGAAAPGLDVSALAFDPTALQAGLTAIQASLTAISQLLTTIHTVDLILLTAAVITFATGAVAQLTLVFTATNQENVLLMQMATVTLPQLLTQSTTTTTGMVTGLTQVIAVTIQENTLIAQMIALVAQLQAAAKTMADKMVDAWERISEATEEAGEAVDNLAKLYSKLAAAAREAQSAAQGVASAAASQGLGFSAGVGFAKGVGFAGGTLGWTVPAGFNRDNFMVGLTSGEEVIVAPRGRSIEEIVGARFGGGNVSSLTVQINNPVINNGMDLANLGAFVRREAARGLSGTG